MPITKKVLSTKITIDERDSNANDCHLIQTGTAEEKKAAEARLIMRNQGLIKMIAYKYSAFCDSVIELEDLEVSASMGLLRAAQTYKPEIAEFSTYATIWMRQQVTRDLSETKSTVRLPVHVVELYYRAKKKYSPLSGNQFYNAIKNDKDFTDNEKKSILDAWGILNIDSLDRPVGDVSEPDAVLGDFKASEENVEEKVLQGIESDELKKLVNDTLDDKKAWVIRHRFGLEDGTSWTLEECGQKYPGGPVTRERIRQIEEKSIRILRIAAVRKKKLWNPSYVPPVITETPEMRKIRLEGQNLDYIKTLPRIKDRHNTDESSVEEAREEIVIPQKIKDKSRKKSEPKTAAKHNKSESNNELNKEIEAIKVSLSCAVNRYNESRGNTKREAKKAVTFFERKLDKLQKELKAAKPEA